MAIYKPKPRVKDSQGSPLDRRKSRRLSPDEIPNFKSVRLLAGQEIQLINLSAGGAMLESTTRIMPGAKICIRLVAHDALFLLHGRVLQSRASALSESGITYQCRVAFDEEFSLLAGLEGRTSQALPAAHPDSIEQAAEAAQVFPAVINHESTSSMTVTVPVPKSERDLRHVFGQ